MSGSWLTYPTHGKYQFFLFLSSYTRQVSVFFFFFLLSYTRQVSVVTCKASSRACFLFRIMADLSYTQQVSVLFYPTHGKYQFYSFSFFYTTHGKCQFFSFSFILHTASVSGDLQGFQSCLLCIQDHGWPILHTASVSGDLQGIWSTRSLHIYYYIYVYMICKNDVRELLLSLRSHQIT